LDQRVADLEARLQLNSTNSSKPPSSEPIGLKRKLPSPPTGRKSGGQPGHVRAQSPLVAPEKLRSSTDCRSDTCRRCAHPLRGDDPEPLINREDGTKCRCSTTARTCAEILRVEEELWNFVWFPRVEPTNNAAERALRHAVIWRRISGGTASESGSRFVERMLTVVATCRQQGRNVLEHLTSCFEADRRSQSIPSLPPATEPAINVA
jgi:hypothetical protein